MRHFYALVCFILCAFVAITIAVEFFRGSKVIQRKQQLGFLGSMVELTHRNTRRYGGYIIHMGMVLLFIGFAGQAFTQNGQTELEIGQSLEVGRYQFKLTDLKEAQGVNYVSSTAYFDVFREGEKIAEMHPEQRVYNAGRDAQPTGIPHIRPRLNEDIYIVFAGYTRDGKLPIIQAYVNPLLSWVWIGGLTVVFGTLVALIPSKIRRIHPKTRIVGAVRKEREVTAKS
jgi:cytochrome c-type biogenesis protein CcmF